MITIILADDHRIIREGLRALIEREPDMRIEAEAADGLAAVSLAREHKPSLIIMDLAMPLMNGTDATRQIVSELPGVKVIALSMHSDKRFVGQALRAGARGYLLKDSAFEELATAVRQVVAGKYYLSASIAGLVVEEYLTQPSPVTDSPLDVLTPRERQVMQLLAEGKNTKEAAGMLEVSVKTVETHRQNVMEKLGIRSVAELTRFAIRCGLISE